MKGQLLDIKPRTKAVFYVLGSLISLVGLGILLCWLFVNKEVILGSVNVLVNGTSAIATTDENFICATLDWWPPQKCDYGTCSWGKASLLKLDLENPILLNAVKAFSPLKIRLGGTLQDRVIYETKGDGKPCTPFVKDHSEFLGFSQGCLPMSRWDELNVFFRKAGALVVFGLNALNGRTIDSHGKAVGAWNSSNAESLLRYTVNNGYKIHGWELGNELCGSHKIGAIIAEDQYASDVETLQNLVQKIYKGFEVKPLVIAPGGFLDTNWFTKFIKKAPTSLQAVTQHIYNLGGGDDKNLTSKILDPNYLKSGSKNFIRLQQILKNSGSSAVAWVGEAGGVHSSGQNLVSNAFVNSFWYLDQLGMAASYDTKTYCRQTLIGGNYGLLNTETFVPNPDYYSALLWHRLMGSRALFTNSTGASNIRAYAHCSKKSQGITLLLINLDADTRFEVCISTENPTGNGTSIMNLEERTERLKFGSLTRRCKRSSTDMREEYHLKAKDGDLHSQTVLLNDKVLTVSSSGEIPPMEPKQVSMSDPIRVDHFSIVFSHIPSLKFPACA
ncbi:hypothetical protein SLE2022_185940 [Rubroshorea leprosula]